MFRVVTMRLAVFVIAAVFLALVDAPPARATVPETLQSPFGIVGYEYDRAHELGAAWLRQETPVYTLMPSPSTWDFWAWEARLDSIETRGLNFAPILMVSQSWMSGFGTNELYPSYPPTDLSITWNPSYGYSQTYYQYIYGVVDHFRGRIEEISIEMEQNSHWAGTADEYIRLLKTGYLAAHNADPGITVLDGGIASEAWGACIAQERILSGLYTDQQILDWVNAYYDRSTYFPVYFTTMPALQSWLSSPFVADQIQRVNYMLGNMNGCVDAFNIKYTEYWWLYADVINYIDSRTAAAGYHVDVKYNHEASVWPGASETQYGRELLQQTIEGLRLGVDRICWFPCSNQYTETPRVGLVDSLGAIRQTGQTFQYASRQIGAHYAFDYLDLTVPNVRQYVFRHRTDAQRTLRVCWYDNGTHLPGSANVRFTLPQNTVRVTKSDNIDRRTTAAIAGETFIDISVSDAPMYLEIVQDLGLRTGVPGTPAPTAAGAAAAPRLEQNFPNPFHPTTTIVYEVPGATGETRPVRLTVYDAQGRLVRELVSGERASGVHQAWWSGESDSGETLPPGIYLYRLESGDFRETRKMILSR